MSNCSRKVPREVYLQDVPLDTARTLLREALDKLPGWPVRRTERVSLANARGRVTAMPVWALNSSPSFAAAAMDGAAVLAEATIGATETSPRVLKRESEAVWIDTGDPMPAETDAVVMVEDIHDRGDGFIEILAAVSPWQHVRPIGEDIVATELVVPQYRKLEPRDLGAIAAAGHADVEVLARPRVTVIPTGSELVPIGACPGPGELIEFNGLVLSSLAESWGAASVCSEIVPDESSAIRAAVSRAVLTADVVVINAGSSAGREDFSASVLDELGEVLVHGVAIRPGHPVVLGIVDGKPAIGIPGYPVSAALTFELFVRPLVEECLCLPTTKSQVISAVMARKTVSVAGDDEFIRVRVGCVGDRVVAAPLERAAGVIMSLVRADGLVRIPRFSEGVAAGEEIEVHMFDTAGAPCDAAVAIGSHDPALDVLASEVSRRAAPLRLASTNAGSYGGLLALRRGEAHMAGCHLLDEASGTYNHVSVKRVLPGRDVQLVHFAMREQGLIVPRGNPLGLREIGDIARAGVSFINRQRGSGTRALLDHRLRVEGIDAEVIQGYEREQYTHLAVAAQVQSGGADVALGVRAAARALNMDFVPVGMEQYDLVIPVEYLEVPAVAVVVEILHDQEFSRQVDAMGGYDVSGMGEVRRDLPIDESGTNGPRW
jgi:putative molybdopterin biosynthesis protein